MPDSTSGRPASGPAILEHVIAVEAQLGAFHERAEAHWAHEEERMRLVDQFVDPQLNLEGLLKQLLTILDRNQRSLHALEAEMRRLIGAVELLVSETGLTRENGR